MIAPIVLCQIATDTGESVFPNFLRIIVKIAPLIQLARARYTPIDIAPLNGLVISIIPTNPEMIALILHKPICSDKNIGANRATNTAEDCVIAVT